MQTLRRCSSIIIIGSRRQTCQMKTVREMATETGLRLSRDANVAILRSIDTAATVFRYW